MAGFLDRFRKGDASSEKQDSSETPKDKKKLILAGTGAGVAVLLIGYIAYSSFSAPKLVSRVRKPDAAPAPPPPAADSKDEAANKEPDSTTNGKGPKNDGQAATPDAKPKGAKDKEPETGDGNPADPKTAEPAPPPRPEDLANWETKDYETAKQDNDKLLSEAVARLDKMPSSQKAAEFLTVLLRVDPPLPPPAEGEKPRKSSRSADEEVTVPSNLVQPIIKALAKNTTPTALATLRDVLTGKFRTPLDAQPSLDAVIVAMGENLRPEYEDLLFVMITKPQLLIDKVREASKDPKPTLDPLWLMRTAWERSAAKASPKLRLRLAIALKDASVPLETAEFIEARLTEVKPENVECQVELYNNPQSQPKTVDAIERQIAEAAKIALAEAIGAPPAGASKTTVSLPSRPSLDPSAATSAPKPVDPVVAMRTASLAASGAIWNDATIDTALARIKAAEAGRSKPESAIIIAATPTNAGRRAIAELIATSGDPSNLSRLFGQGDSLLLNPFMLLELKSVGLQEPASSTKSPRVRRPNDAPPKDAKQEVWNRIIFNGVKVLSERIRTSPASTYKEAPGEEAPKKTTPAAGDGKPADPTANPTADTLEALVKPGNDARITNDFTMKWPGGVPSGLPTKSLAHARIRYLRFEEPISQEKAVSRYKKLTRKAVAVKPPEGGDGGWLSDHAVDVKTGIERSVDVVIRPAAGGSTAEGPVVVEVLMIEAKSAAEAPTPSGG